MKHSNMRCGTFVGTPLYVAPEMLENNESGFFTDIWSLGCIIYEMVVGKSPFMGDNNTQVFKNILECKLDFPKETDDQAKDLI